MNILRTPSSSTQQNIMQPLYRYLSLSLCCLLCLSFPLNYYALDESYPSIKANNIAFGSCHRLSALDEPSHKNHPPLIQSISNSKPDVFIWSGDSIYNRPSTPEALKAGYRAMKAFPPYKSLIENTFIAGTWDDHDYGANDAGKEMKGKRERADAFLDFLDVSPTSPRRSRDGVYHSVAINDGKVKIIFLDTRWHRDLHFFPSVASYKKLPFKAVIASFSRLMVSLLGLGQGHAGEMLGEQQWKWLEEELVESESMFHIVVSSVQVLTTNPLVESWGAFPMEKNRLLRLFNTTNPKNLILLSGDVHHAEVSKVKDIVEATSSGLTHSCSSPFYGFVCDFMLTTFPLHRFDNIFYSSRNYGKLAINESDESISIEIYGEDGTLVRSAVAEGGRDFRITEEEIRNVPQTIQRSTSKTLIRFVLLPLLVLVMSVISVVGMRMIPEPSKQRKGKGKSGDEKKKE